MLHADERKCSLLQGANCTPADCDAGAGAHHPAGVLFEIDPGYEYVGKPWTECSATCGGGHRKREVVTESARALTVTIRVRRYGKRLQLCWLFNFVCYGC